jgi:hypothetical protein
MPTLNAADTKGTCHLAYDAVKGERYSFPDRAVWVVLDSIGTRATGFKAILVQPRDGVKNVTVLAFAGTDSILDGLVDLQQATGGMPAQYHQALALTKRYQGQYANLYLTGHSLGGGLAAYSSVTTKLPASTINPAPLVGAMSLSSLGGNQQITNYVPRNREVVSSSPGRNPGTDIPVEASGNYFTRHMVANVMPNIGLPQKTGSGASGSW